MKKALKILSIILVAFLAISMLTACSPKTDDEPKTTEATTEKTVITTTEETTEPKQTLVLGVDASLVPYEYVKNGEVIGINIDVAKAIANELDMTLEIQTDEKDGALKRVADNKCDIAMLSVSFMEDGFGEVKFSNVYSHEIQSVVVKATAEYNSYDDFYSEFASDGAPTGLKDGIKIGVQKGTTAEKYSSKSFEEWGFEKENVVVYSTGEEAMKALEADEITAVVIEDEQAKQIMETISGLKILDSSYIEQDFAIGVSPDNQELVEKINSAITKLKNNGTIERIIKDNIITK